MKGVIFDFNGTMFLDSDKQIEAWHQFFRQVCKREVSEEEFHAHVHGRNNIMILEHFMQKKLTKQEAREIAEIKEECYRRLCVEDPEHFCFTPGLEPFLQELLQKQVPMTIATASTKENVELYLSHFKLEQWFDPGKIVYDDGTLPGKPDPEIYRRAANNLGLEPRDCVVFEDAMSGIEAAKRAGIGKIVTLDSTVKREELQKLEGIDSIISDFCTMSWEILK